MKGELSMNAKRIISCALSILSGLALSAPLTVAASAKPSSDRATAVTFQSPKVMREFRGVKLGLKAEEVHAALGKPESPNENREDYKIGGDDMLTVHYDAGLVKAIQLYFTSPKNVPAWTEVVGDAEIQQNENGSKQARVVITAEKFWVAMYQNKDATVTTITISR
jgi:hypothetical protein